MEDSIDICDLIDVICVSNIITHEPHNDYHRVINKLEIGKIYKCKYNFSKSNDYNHYMHYVILDDYPNNSGLYSHYLFITLAEWREKQINSILEEI